MKIGNVSFGARIDRNTMDFLIKARQKGLKTEKMETLMKQVYPDEVIYTEYDDLGENISYMKFFNIIFLPPKYIPGTKRYIQSGSQLNPYKINQNTVNTITKCLEEIKKNDTTTENTKVLFPKIFKRDHEEELTKIFGKPL